MRGLKLWMFFDKINEGENNEKRFIFSTLLRKPMDLQFLGIEGHRGLRGAMCVVLIIIF